MSRTLNIRLQRDDEKIVQRLRAKGVNVSELLRGKLREEDEKRAAKSKSRKPSEILRSLLEEFPIPQDAAPHHGIDLTDRRAMSEYIRQRVIAKHRRIQDDFVRQQRTGRTRRSA